MIIFRLFQKEILLTILFALLNACAFNFTECAPLAFVSLVPLFFCIQSTKSNSEALFFGYLAGVLLFGAVLYYIFYVAIFGFICLALYLGVFIAFFSIISRGALKALSGSGSSVFKNGWLRIFTVASIWILVEYLRSNVPVMRFPWALMSYSQWLNLPFIQSAEIIGPYGVSFIIVVVNLSVYALLNVFWRMIRYDLAFFDAIKQCLIIVFVALIFAGLNIGFGHWRLSQEDLSIKEEFGPKISVIQGNIPQDQKWDERVKKMIYKKYDGLSRQAALEGPDLVVWPETSFPGYWEEEPVMGHQLRYLIKDVGSRFLVGSPALFVDDNQERKRNSALYLDDQGNLRGRYDKLRLVPFGEYAPCLSFMKNFYPIGGFTHGASIVMFQLPYGIGGELNTYFSVLICFEDIFPDLCRMNVKNGSRILINITNDAWFLKSKAPYQHAQASVLRAVENRVPVVRAANTGLSCFIDQAGRITDSVKEAGEELFVSGFKTRRVTPGHGSTLYTRFGDIAVILALLIVVAAILLTRNRANS